MPGLVPGIHDFPTRASKAWMAAASPTMMPYGCDDVCLALGRLYHHRRVLPDPAQRHAARAHHHAWHCRRHACAVSVRLPVRADLPPRPDCRHGCAAAAARLGVLALGHRRRRCADRRHRNDADGDGRTLVRRHHRLYQDRANPGSDLRPDLSWRRRVVAADDCDHRCHRGRTHHVDPKPARAWSAASSRR